MSFTTAEGRQDVLDSLAEAIDHLALAMTALGDAYEQLDEQMADRMEEELFGPVQRAYGRAKRTHSEFSARAGIPPREFGARSAGLASQGAKALVESAANAAAAADNVLGELQDTMLPIEVGDPELRAGLADVRSLAAAIPGRARELTRTFGR